MTPTQFKLVYDSVDCNGVDERKTAKIPLTRNCFGRSCSFETLLKMHQRDNPELAYLMARVEDVREDVDFYDGSCAVQQLSGRFCDLLHNETVAKSVTFFAYVKTKGDKHCFRQVAHCTSRAAIGSNTLLQKYARGEDPLLTTFNRACRMVEIDNQEIQAAGRSLLGQACKTCLEKASEAINADVIEVLGRLSVLYYVGKKGLNTDYKIALQLSEKLLEIDPNNARALGQSGIIYFAGCDGMPRDLVRAKAYLQSAARIEPELYAMHQELGKLALEEGNPNEAKACLEKAYSLKSDDVESALLLAELLGSAKYTEVVQQDLAKANQLVRHVLWRAPHNEKALGLQFSFQRL